MTDKAIRRQQFAAVLIVAALAAVVSYSHIRDLAVTHGGDTLTSALLPLLIDGTVAVMSFAMVRAARSGDTRVPWLVRFMLVLFAGATLAANLDYGAAYGVTGALLWTLPAVAFVGCIEVMVLMVRRTDADEAAEDDAADDTMPDQPRQFPHAMARTQSSQKPAAARMSATMTVKQQQAERENVKPLTVKQQAAILGKHPRTVARYRKDGSIDDMLAAVSPNGKVH